MHLIQPESSPGGGNPFGSLTAKSVGLPQCTESPGGPARRCASQGPRPQALGVLPSVIVPAWAVTTGVASISTDAPLTPCSRPLCAARSGVTALWHTSTQAKHGGWGPVQAGSDAEMPRAALRPHCASSPSPAPGACGPEREALAVLLTVLSHNLLYVEDRAGPSVPQSSLQEVSQLPSMETTRRAVPHLHLCSISSKKRIF